MRIRITITFTDKQAADPENAEVEAGAEMTVTAERGAELVGLGLAVDLTEVPTKPPRRSRRKKATTALPALPAPTVPPAIAADPVPPVENGEQ